MSEALKKQILEKIKQYDKIVIARHTRPDGDAVGTSHGLAEVLRAGFPEKQILVVNEDVSTYLSFLGPDDPDPGEDFYRSALGIAVDTGTMDRLSNQKIGLCPELVKIDHHIDDKPYGDISWVEPERSSCAEMIVDFQQQFKDILPMTKEAALFLYTGLVTDSGRFRFDSVSGDTLRLAAVHLDTGIDTETLFANLYLEDFEYFRYESYTYEHMQCTPSGVVYLYVDEAMQTRFGLDREQASNTISFLDTIRGSIIWLAFIDNPDGSIRVRLRSRFVGVQELATHYHGGGHEKAAGSTVYSREEMEQLIAEADALCAAYKKEHTGWL